MMSNVSARNRWFQGLASLLPAVMGRAWIQVLASPVNFCVSSELTLRLSPWGTLHLLFQVEQQVGLLDI